MKDGIAGNWIVGESSQALSTSVKNSPTTVNTAPSGIARAEEEVLILLFRDSDDQTSTTCTRCSHEAEGQK